MQNNLDSKINSFASLANLKFVPVYHDKPLSSANGSDKQVEPYPIWGKGSLREVQE